MTAADPRPMPVRLVIDAPVAPAASDATESMLRQHALGEGSDSPTAGTVIGTPRSWLRLEAATLLTGSIVAYARTHQSWWLFALLVLVPDVTIAAYLRGNRLGAHLYNLAHATPVPATLLVIGWSQHTPMVVAVGLLWTAHIGLDRLMGYGLKYGDHFQHTHLGCLGRSGH
jgi:hypothetical protein